MQDCPTCGVYETPQPSENVPCNANYQCDGCQACNDHLY